MRGSVVIVLAAALALMTLTSVGLTGGRSGNPSPFGTGAKDPHIESRDIARVSAQPSILLQRTWGGSYFDSADAVTTDSAGNIYEAGYTISFGVCSPSWASISLLKYSATGTLLMQKVWSNGTGLLMVSGIAVDAAGDIYVAGSNLYSSCGGGYWYASLFKFDPAGNLLWGKTLPATDSGFAGVALDSSGNAYVTGELYGPSGSTDVLLMKFNASGDVVWEESWGGSGVDSGSGVAVDASGNVYVAGSSTSYGASGWSTVLLKLDASGNLLFRKIVGNGSEEAYGLALDGAGDIYEVGTSYAGTERVLVLKYDATSGLIWQRTWGGPGGPSYGASVAVDPSGNLEIAGYTGAYGSGGTCSFPNPCADLLVLGISASGNLLSQIVYGIPGVNEEATGVADSFGRAVVVGAVGGAPPYQTATGNTSLGTPALYASTYGNSTVATLTYALPSITGGSSSTPSGNQSFAGQEDEIMLEFGTPPTLSFATDPAAGGNITFNGTSFSNATSASVPLGNATATASPNAGYNFTGWSASGGVTLANATARTVRVTVIGSGVLTAHFELTASPPPSGGSSQGGPPPLVLGAVGAIVVIGVAIVAVVYLTRRRRRRGATPPPSTPPPP